MSNTEEAKRHLNSAKLEIKLSQKYLESGYYDVEYVLSMLTEAMKRIDVVIENYCE